MRTINKYYVLADILSYTDLNKLRNLFNLQLTQANAKKHKNGSTIKRRNTSDERGAGDVKRKRNYVVEICNAATQVRMLKDLLVFEVSDYDKKEAIKILSIIGYGMCEKYENRVKTYNARLV